MYDTTTTLRRAAHDPRPFDPLRRVLWSILVGSAAAACSGSGENAGPAPTTGGVPATPPGSAGATMTPTAGHSATAGGAGVLTAGGTATGDGGTTTSSGGGGGGTATGGGGGGACDPTCSDTPPDDTYTCQEQAGWGQCQQAWMQGYCRESCGQCVPCGGGTAGASSGTAGTSNVGDCAVEPANPNANRQARLLLCYLYSINGNYVLSGQQETSWDNPEHDPEWINQNTGRYPAILGGDYLYPNGTTARAIAWWHAGGIPMIRYHMGAPPDADSYESSLTSSDISRVLTPGTPENDSFMGKLDYAATELQALQDAGVAVLWAPFHESQPEGWFWWSKGTGAELVQLWTTMFDYFTASKGLNNLVWLMPFSGNPDPTFYPGEAYVDLVGPDTYETNQPFTWAYVATRNIVGSSLPLALHETGTIPNPDDMFDSNAAPWVLFSVWAGYQISENSLGDVQRAYESPYTLTRDEVPALR